MGKSPRFYVPPECVNGNRIELPDPVIRHGVHTLRLKPGEDLILFDGSGTEYRASLEKEGGDRYYAEVRSSAPGIVPSPPRISLYQAPMKKERWEWLIEKATEIGVHVIIPLMTRFTEMEVSRSFEKKKERWDSIAQSACEQCGRSVLPKLLPPVPLTLALKDAPGRKFFFYEKEGESLKTLLPGIAPPVELSLFVGPEGGFSLEEASLAGSMGVSLATLGGVILRAETAGIVAATIMAFWFARDE